MGSAPGRAAPRIAMCDAEEFSLQAELKKAAASRLGASLESMMRPEDRQETDRASSSMADAIRQAKEHLAKRKGEIGEEAALAELDASIRGRPTPAEPDANAERTMPTQTDEAT
jgi:hypothetical protein